jgi:LPS-assembly lipoprotein
MKKYFLYLIAVLVLNACGFQVRNQNELAQPLHMLYIKTDSPYGSFESGLRQTLHSSGVTLTDNARTAPVILQLSKPYETNANTTIGPSSQSRAYALDYQVTYTLMDAHGKIFIGPETLSTYRNLILSPNQLPQSNNQTDVLKYEMERDLISQLYNRLRSKQVDDALSKNSTHP